MKPLISLLPLKDLESIPHTALKNLIRVFYNLTCHVYLIFLEWNNGAHKQANNV